MQSARKRPRSRVATDVGGTFTDVVTFDEVTGASSFGKTLTTPEHLVDGIINANTSAVRRMNSLICRSFPMNRSRTMTARNVSFASRLATFADCLIEAVSGRLQSD